MVLQLQIIDYSDLKDGLLFDKDKYGIMSYQYQTRRKTLLSNPNLSDYSKPYMIIGIADNIIVGRAMLYPSLFKAGNCIEKAAVGSSFHVKEEFRKEGIGADIILSQIKNCGADVKISAGLSPMALPINKAMRNTIFFFPKFWQLKRTSSFFRYLGLNGWFLKVVSGLFDYPIKLINSLQLRGVDNLINEYSVEEVNEVPRWVDEIIFNDGHKYMELHDHKWLQWNLDYNFCEGKDNIQLFYIIKDVDKPIGFFMIKQRRYINTWRLKDSIVSSIVEWGVSKECSLTEHDIIKIASKIIQGNTDVLEIATTNEELAKKLKKKGFLSMGNANVSLKDMRKKYPDFKKKDLWRLRLGYGDVILSI